MLSFKSGSLRLEKGYHDGFFCCTMLIAEPNFELR